MKRAPHKGGAVLLIGAGRMGGALLRGWLTAKCATAITVIEPHPSAELRRLAARRKIRLSDSFELGPDPRYAAAVLAVKPQVLKTQAELLRALGKSGALVLSIAAGIPARALAAGLGGHAAVVRAMPNTPGAIGHGITALYAHGKTSLRERTLAETLMAVIGETLWVSKETLLDGVTAVSGSGPAYVFLLTEALAAAGRAQGLGEKLSEKLARATVAGAGALLDADPRPAAELRKEVASPGGTTQAALKILLGKDGLKPLLRRAVAAAARRSKELGS